ncbi:MAG: D-alanyl-D-alanine carboxypeptidase [Muribaculum sp.]|nr:D-alanyl-D-alanine carboxypeptidase [Muribaculum sp.]
MKIFLLISLQLLSVALVYAASPLETFLKNRAVNAESTSIYVQDLSTGKVLAQHNSDLPLLPASIMKTVTIAGLLKEKGADERFHTKVYADGKISGGNIAGDLLVVGGGDPTLGANCLPESKDIADEIVDALKSMGVKVIDGDLRVDTSLYVGPACPPSWVREDRRESYGTGSHALNFRRNASGSRAVYDPVSVFQNYLKTRLASAGIAIEGGLVQGGEGLADEKRATLLVDHVSDRYAEVMRSCMMRSDNLFAENLLRTFAIARSRDGSTVAGADEMLQFWINEGIPAKGVNIVDGSGLSRSNRVTARFMAGIMEEMNEDEDFSTFLPLAGQEGTLSDFLKDTALDSYVAMKTGSMRGIQCYAGYKLDERFAPTHSIVIIMNEIGKRPQARAAAERLLLDLFTTN